MFNLHTLIHSGGNVYCSTVQMYLYNTILNILNYFQVMYFHYLVHIDFQEAFGGIPDACPSHLSGKIPIVLNCVSCGLNSQVLMGVGNESSKLGYVPTFYTVSWVLYQNTPKYITSVHRLRDCYASDRFLPTNVMQGTMELLMLTIKSPSWSGTPQL